MNKFKSTVEDHVVFTREVLGIPVKIITYKLEDRHICIINNLDPGATICRSASYDSGTALRAALERARELLAQCEACLERPNQPQVGTLEKVVFTDGGEPIIYSASAFLELPSKIMMLHVLSGKIAYFDDEGRSIPAGDAMVQLHRCAALQAA